MIANPLPANSTTMCKSVIKAPHAMTKLLPTIFLFRWSQRFQRVEEKKKKNQSFPPKYPTIGNIKKNGIFADYVIFLRNDTL